MYNMYRELKDKYYKYLIRMYWVLDKRIFKNAKYIYKWHLVEV